MENLNEGEELVLRAARKLQQRYEVEFQGNGFSLSVVDNQINNEEEQNAVFFAQGEEAEHIISSSECDYLTREQSVLFYLDSAGALQ